MNSTKETFLPSLDYIAGVVETSGSFFWVKSGKKENPVFHIKLIGKERAILELISQKLGLGGGVYEYLHGGRHYALLIVRKRSVIERVIIPTFDQRLLGTKKIQFEAWRDRFNRQQLAKITDVSQETIVSSPLEIEN